MRIVVLLNLKSGKSEQDYLNWARTTDIPTVNKLESVERFQLLKATSVLGGGTLPYQYIEILDVSDMGLFGEETSSERMQKVAAEFNDWADPVFILTEDAGVAA